MTVGGSEVATVVTGDCFGEIAFLDSGLRTATVTTTSPAKLLVMFGSEFRRLQDGHHELAARFAELMRERIGA